MGKPRKDEFYAIIRIDRGIVHLECTVNPDASCCQGTRDGLQLEYYDWAGWNEPKGNPRLASAFWDVWTEWNGKFCGGITLDDDYNQRLWKMERKGLKVVSPDKIKDLEDGRYVVYAEMGEK